MQYCFFKFSWLFEHVDRNMLIEKKFKRALNGKWGGGGGIKGWAKYTKIQIFKNSSLLPQMLGKNLMHSYDAHGAFY